MDQAKIWEDGLRTDPNKKSYEWWYFDASLDDGSTIVITFFTKPSQYAKGPLKPEMQVVYTSPKGKKNSFDKTYQASTFKASIEKCDVEIGPNKVSGDLKKYKIHIDLPEIKGDFEFDRISPSYSTTEKKESKPEAVGWFPAIPYGSVSGTFHFEGQVLKVKGTGYHDHNWGTVDMKDICKYWYWGRGSAGDYHIVFSILYLPKILGGRHGSVFYLAKGEKMIVGKSDQLELTYTNITPPTPKVGHLPTKLTFTFTDADVKADFTLTDPQLIDSVDPFGSDSGVRKFLVHLISKPLYVRYNADLELNLLVEGEKDNKKGKGLFEIMILH